jgi:hypothetical protein
MNDAGPARLLEISIESRLRAPVRIVAADALSLRGVNDELGPWLRMTAPRGWERRPINQWPIGRSLFVSWILVLGLIPAGRHVFGMTEVSEAGFCESSHSLLLRRWSHRRRITGDQAVANVVDRISLEPRFPWLGPLMLPVYRQVFAWRHRRLRSRYASAIGRNNDA